MRFDSICVLGLGYIGLPTASTFAVKGQQVLGVDIRPAVLAALQGGESHIQEPGMQELVRQAFDSGNLRISDRPAPADAFVIAVQTPIQDDKRADLSFVVSAAQSIAPQLQRGNLVVLESTCPPRTTTGVVKPILESSGLQAGSDFLLAYMPERVLPGKILKELVENDRIIGGVDDESARAARDLYASFVTGELLLTDSTTAEFVKLMENTYRDVNVAIANEFSRIAEQLGVNVWQAIRMANRHPRVQILRPGPGAGGHCVGVDPWFLVESAPEHSQLIRQARLVNDGQPAFAVETIRRAIGELRGARLAALGLAYKPNVDDLRSSPAIEIVQRLVAGGAQVTSFEPFKLDAQVEGAQAAASLDEALRQAEAVVALVGHRPVVELDPAHARGLMAGSLAVDLCGAWEAEAWEAAGFTMRTLGVGARAEG